MKPTRRCPACGRATALMISRTRRVGGKSSPHHKCPHGKPCISGDPQYAAGGWNPGGFAHNLRCPDCALRINREAREAS